LLEKTMKIMKVLILLAVTFVFVSCAKETPVAKEEASTTVRGEGAAKKLASLIPEGWQVSSQLQAEPLVVGYDYSGDGKLDFIALLERVPGGDAGPGSFVRHVLRPEYCRWQTAAGIHEPRCFPGKPDRVLLRCCP
jgi:hypothetical protein